MSYSSSANSSSLVPFTLYSWLQLEGNLDYHTVYIKSFVSISDYLVTNTKEIFSKELAKWLVDTENADNMP